MAETASHNAGVDSPRAWLVVVAGFFSTCVAFGVSYAFGVFLKPLMATFHVSHATLATLFSAVTVLSFFLGPVTGRLADRIGPRPVVAAGAVLMAGGLLASARAQWFPLLYLTFGVCVGAAVACTYVPSIAAVGESFKVERDMALGIAITGTGLGTLIGAPAAAQLIHFYGWREAFEVFGWVSLAVLLACAALLKRPPVVRKQATVDVWSTMRSRTFGLLYAGLGFRGIALYITIVFLPVFATDLGYSHRTAAGLIGYLGVASIAGRFGLNAIAPRFGLMNTYLASCVIVLVACVIWVMSHGYWTLVAFALAMGVGYGANAAMTPAVVASKFGIEALGRLLGWLYTSFGLACFAGPPLAGVLADRTHDFRLPTVLALVAAVVSVAAIVPLRTSMPQRAMAMAD
jgi:MFS family permease